MFKKTKQNHFLLNQGSDLLDDGTEQNCGLARIPSISKIYDLASLCDIKTGHVVVEQKLYYLKSFSSHIVY